METIDINENQKQQQQKENMQKKLKEDITKFFIQLKNGCSRKYCYNPHCKKSNHHSQKNDKEILSLSMTLVRNQNYSTNFCINSNKFNFKEINLENFLAEFDENNLDINSYFDLDRMPPMNFDYKKLSSKIENIDLLEFLKIVNNFWDFIFKEYPLTEFSIKENLKNKCFTRLNFYLHYINLRFLVMISLHPNFNYSAESHSFMFNYFENVTKAQKNFKIFLKFYKNGYLSIESNPNYSYNAEKNLKYLENELLNTQKNYSFNEVFNLYSENDSSKNLNDISKNNDSSIGKIFPNFSEANKNNTNNENFNEKEISFDAYFQKISQLDLSLNNKDIIGNRETLLQNLLIKTSSYNDINNLTNGFFDTFSIFRNFFQFSSFIDFLKNKEIFINIIHSYQNFLLLIIMFGTLEKNYLDKKHTAMIFSFLPVFEIFFKTNEILKIIKPEEFYNEYINKNVGVNFKWECENYLKHLNGEKSDKNDFSWLEYFFIFNEKSKSDILNLFNLITQRQEYENTINSFNVNQMLLDRDSANPFLIIQIKRDNMIENSLNFLVNSNLNFKKPLKVKFIGEQGIDEGGVKKEYFLLLVRQLFNPEYGMFSYNEKTRFFWFNRNSFEIIIKFELIGIIFGLAFFNNVILDVKFPLVVYKKLLNIKPTLEDLKEIDEDLYNNFKYLLTTKEQNLRDILETTFTVTVENFGEKEMIPLKENGENIYIDNNNRFEYVELYLDWYFNKSIERFFCKFYKGFYRVCDHRLFHILKAEELELIICGNQILDFIELQKAASYQDGYEEDSDTIKLFWEVIHEFNDEEKKKFLLFLTGCDRAPLDGLGSLVITISRFGPDSDKLPCAHTCFNHLLLPEYKEKDKMKTRLLTAINHSEGFGLL